jgi:hypothetical protein
VERPLELFTVRVPNQLHDHLIKMADRRDVSVSRLARCLIIRGLNHD